MWPGIGTDFQVLIFAALSVATAPAAWPLTRPAGVLCAVSVPAIFFAAFSSIAMPNRFASSACCRSASR